MKKISQTMKQFKTLAIAAALFGCTVANAQTHDVSLNLAPMVLGNYSLNYSFNFQEDMSAGTVIGYQNLKIDDGTTTYSYKGFYVAPEFRYYFNPDEGNDGFFAGGYLKYRNMGTEGEPYIGVLEDGTDVLYDTKNSGLALGILTGKLWQTRFGMNITIWSGIGYYLINKTTYTNSYNPDTDPYLTTTYTNLPTLDFRLGLNIGYRIGY
jgi:hypothetical protein